MVGAQVRLQKLETRVTWLEQTVQELRGNQRLTMVREDEAESLSEREWLLTKLKAEGLIRDLTPQERVHAERWRALPEEEKKVIIHEMQNLKPGPMLSDIIIQNRR